jgi:hypothetical protein
LLCTQGKTHLKHERQDCAKHTQNLSLPSGGAKVLLVDANLGFKHVSFAQEEGSCGIGLEVVPCQTLSNISATLKFLTTRRVRTYSCQLSFMVPALKIVQNMYLKVTSSSHSSPLVRFSSQHGPTSWLSRINIPNTRIPLKQQD